MPLLNKQTINVTIGAQIKSWRRLRKISQVKLGEMIGVHYQSIQKYENGSDSISLWRFIHIAEALGFGNEPFSMLDLAPTLRAAELEKLPKVRATMEAARQ